MASAGCATSPRTREVVEERFASGAPEVVGTEIEVEPGRWLADGLWRQYYEDGSLEVEWHFRAGVEEGTWTAWFETGSMHMRGNFIGGYEEGVWVEFHENGKKANEGRYAAGEEDGAWTHWYASGSLASVEYYDCGDRRGVWQEWYEDGQLKSRYDYGDDGRIISKVELLPDGAPDPLDGGFVIDPEARLLLRNAADQRVWR